MSRQDAQSSGHAPSCGLNYDWIDVQLLGGVRYLSLDAEAELDTSIVPGGGIEVDASDDVWDGIIGVRGLANLSDKWRNRADGIRLVNNQI